MADPENREKAEVILKRSKERFYKFEPYYNRTDGKPSWQWDFLKGAADGLGTVALGANRIGKSDMGAYAAVLAVTGQHPHRDFPRTGKGWIVGSDFAMTRDVNLPKFESLLPKHFDIHYRKADGIWECGDGDRYWEVYFKSYESGREKFQAAEVDWIWFDEEPKKTEIFNECMMRLIDRAGIWWMTATPVLGTAWLKNLSERDDVTTTYGNMWNNPYLAVEQIKAKSAGLTEEERLVRIEGIYLTFGGRPVFRTYIQALRSRLEEVNKTRPLIGHIESCAA